ncbi:hypothetical protein HDU76_006080 [Blyttiomyces sp. JEL0837]|nr:hypothetical protein HDU76_006080 [Blyttiomyces sp. JEL0837]
MSSPSHPQYPMSKGGNLPPGANHGQPISPITTPNLVSSPFQTNSPFSKGPMSSTRPGFNASTPTNGDLQPPKQFQQAQRSHNTVSSFDSGVGSYTSQDDYHSTPNRGPLSAHSGLSTSTGVSGTASSKLDDLLLSLGDSINEFTIDDHRSSGPGTAGGGYQKTHGPGVGVAGSGDDRRSYGATSTASSGNPPSAGWGSDQFSATSPPARVPSPTTGNNRLSQQSTNSEGEYTVGSLARRAGSHCGYLGKLATSKSNPNNTQWKKRYFVLTDDGRLFLFPTNDPAELPQTFLPLTHVSCRRDDSGTGGGWIIDVRGEGANPDGTIVERQWALLCNDDLQAHAWITNLTASAKQRQTQVTSRPGSMGSVASGGASFMSPSSNPMPIPYQQQQQQQGKRASYGQTSVNSHSSYSNVSNSLQSENGFSSGGYNPNSYGMPPTLATGPPQRVDSGIINMRRPSAGQILVNPQQQYGGDPTARRPSLATDAIGSLPMSAASNTQGPLSASVEDRGAQQRRQYEEYMAARKAAAAQGQPNMPDNAFMSPPMSSVTNTMGQQQYPFPQQQQQQQQQQPSAGGPRKTSASSAEGPSKSDMWKPTTTISEGPSSSTFEPKAGSPGIFASASSSDAKSIASSTSSKQKPKPKTKKPPIMDLDLDMF